MAKAGYHHGNLKQALVDAALELIAERGPAGVTLSEAAKAAGVTPAAVYRHFAGREDLIAECAVQGYAIFADLMDYAFNDGQPSALKGFEAVGRAYLAFARRYPGHYMAMFESGLSLNDHPEMALGAARTQRVLDRAAEALSRHIPPEKPRGGGAVRPRRARRALALSARGVAGNRHRHLPARTGSAAARHLSRA